MERGRRWGKLMVATSVGPRMERMKQPVRSAEVLLMGLLGRLLLERPPMVAVARRLRMLHGVLKLGHGATTWTGRPTSPWIHAAYVPTSKRLEKPSRRTLFHSRSPLRLTPLSTRSSLGTLLLYLRCRTCCGPTTV